MKSENECAAKEEARKALEEERDQKIKTIRELQVNCLHYEQPYNCIRISAVWQIFSDSACVTI